MGCSTVPSIFLVGTVPTNILTVNSNAFNPNCIFKLSGIPITSRASYRIKPKKKTKNKELDYPLSCSLNSRGRTKQLQD